MVRSVPAVPFAAPPPVLLLAVIRARARAAALSRRTLAFRPHGDETLLDWRRLQCPAYQTVARANGSMTGHSPPKTPQAPRACSSKTDKADIYDANIRNFAPVARIMKNALPENAKIAKEAKECMQECVSEFISFITSEGERACPAFSKARNGRVRVMLTYRSVREMPSGKEENSQWRGHPLRHELARVRELRRGTEDLSVQVP